MDDQMSMKLFKFAMQLLILLFPLRGCTRLQEPVSGLVIVLHLAGPEEHVLEIPQGTSSGAQDICTTPNAASC